MNSRRSIESGDGVLTDYLQEFMLSIDRKQRSGPLFHHA
jgi:hypothetical protein